MTLIEAQNEHSRVKAELESVLSELPQAVTVSEEDEIEAVVSGFAPKSALSDRVIELRGRQTALASRIRVLDGVLVKLRQIEAAEKAQQRLELIASLSARYRGKVPEIIAAVLRAHALQAEADAIFFRSPATGVLWRGMGVRG